MIVAMTITRMNDVGLQPRPSRAVLYSIAIVMIENGKPLLTERLVSINYIFCI